MRPIDAVAMVLKENGRALLPFLGSCFAYRSPIHFLTAAHVVRECQREAIVFIPGNGLMCPVQSLEFHPTADIAMMLVQPHPMNFVEPFVGVGADCGLGDDYFAYGFPEDSRPTGAPRPTPRMFRGYFQRFMKHSSHMGYSYAAGEISTPCPAGLSGGPLFRMVADEFAIGLATENIEAATELHAEENILEDGKPVRDVITKRVVNYGVALMLRSVEEWINNLIPPQAGSQRFYDDLADDPAP